MASINGNGINGQTAIGANPDGVNLNNQKNKLKRLRHRLRSRGLALPSVKWGPGDRRYHLVSLYQAVDADELAVKWGADLFGVFSHMEQELLFESVTKGTEDEALSAVLKVRNRASTGGAR